MDLVTVDKLGRILLPKPLRDRLNLKAGARLLAVPTDGKLILQELDVASLARAMAKELEGVDIERIVRDVQKETEREARARYAAVLARHEPAGGSHQAPATPDGQLPSSRRSGRAKRHGPGGKPSPHS